jgi:hypothetical protein
MCRTSISYSSTRQNTPISDILIPPGPIFPVSAAPHNNTPSLRVNQSYTLEKSVMKHADKPFIGILIVTMAILYGVIALLS